MGNETGRREEPKDSEDGSGTLQALGRLARVVPRNLVPALVVHDAGGVELPGQRWSLETQEFTIGRATDNDLVIPDDYVSRKHAVLELRERIWWIRSLKSTNPVILRDREIHDAAPLASTDLITIGSVSLQFLEPVSRSLGETLPFPLALSLQQVQSASSSERRLRAALQGIETSLRFFLAAQFGLLASLERSQHLKRKLGHDFFSERPISMGWCVELICRLARDSRFLTKPDQKGGYPERDAISLTVRNLLHRAGETGTVGALQQRLQRTVELRNDLAHRWLGEEDAYQAEADMVVEELEWLISCFMPFRSLSLLCWLPSDGAIQPVTHQCKVRLLQGPAATFALYEMNVPETIEASWCHLYGGVSLLSLAPFFAVATSPATRRLDLFMSRSARIHLPNQPVTMDGLTSAQEALVPFSCQPYLQDLTKVSES